MPMTPPPPSGLSQGVRTKRPGAPGNRSAGAASSSASNAAWIRSRRCSNQARVSTFFRSSGSENEASLMGSVLDRARRSANLSGLAQAFPKGDAGGHRQVEGAGARAQRHDDAGVGGGVDMVGGARALLAEQQDVVGPEGEVGAGAWRPWWSAEPAVQPGGRPERRPSPRGGSCATGGRNPGRRASSRGRRNGSPSARSHEDRRRNRPKAGCRRRRSEECPVEKGRDAF